MHTYRRRLPHYDIAGQPVFVTFRLHGSLPTNRAFPPASMTSGRAFVAMDRLLDHARYGPHYLEQAAIAELMVRCLYYGAETLQYYELHAFVVMPNHIHLLITPSIALPKLLCSLKTASAKYANRLLRATGKPFWQDESFDRLVRNDDEFRRIQRYIEINPVRAGLV